jgi:hypothetical protein
MMAWCHQSNVNINWLETTAWAKYKKPGWVWTCLSTAAEAPCKVSNEELLENPPCTSSMKAIVVKISKFYGMHICKKLEAYYQ